MASFASQLSETTQQKIINISEMQKIFEHLFRDTTTQAEWRLYTLGKPYAIWQGIKFGARLLFSKKAGWDIYQKCHQRSLGMYMMSPVYQGDVLNKADDYIDVVVMVDIIDRYFPKLVDPYKDFHQKMAQCTIAALEEAIDYTPMFSQGDLIVPDFHIEAIKRLQNEHG